MNPFSHCCSFLIGQIGSSSILMWSSDVNMLCCYLFITFQKKRVVLFWSAFQRAALYLSKQGVFLDVVLIKKSPSFNLKQCSVFLWAIKGCGGEKKKAEPGWNANIISVLWPNVQRKQCARLRIRSPAVTGGGPGARMSTSSSPTAPLNFTYQQTKLVYGRWKSVS